MWVVSEPIVKDWLESQLGAGARIDQAAEGAASVGRFVGDLPKLLRQAERTWRTAFADMAEEGLRLDDESVARLARAQSCRQDRWTRIGMWVGAAGARRHRPVIGVLEDLNARALCRAARRGGSLSVICGRLRQAHDGPRRRASVERQAHPSDRRRRHCRLQVAGTRAPP